MAAQIIGFGLALPDGWGTVPRDLADVAGWSLDEAKRLRPGVPDDEARDLALALGGVAEAVSDAHVTGIEAAYLVRRPELGRVDAILTLVAQQGLSAAAFRADLARLAAADDAGQVFAQEVLGEVPAGDVVGLHLLIGHLDPELDDGVAHLEERVVLGVFPPGCRDAVEVTAVANGVGVFDDMPQTTLDLLAGLSIDDEVAP